ncbi:MAG TPA: hypothetical protein VEL76_16820 [Gemmataceae bacterium]|nr:hypothetical protein [Gemmataceae bacterium]
MRRVTLSFVLITLLPTCAAAADNPDSSAADEKLLQAAQFKTDDASLLEFFRSRVPPPGRQELLNSLINDLGNRFYVRREQSTLALVKEGLDARSFLLRAKNAADCEVARRAELCLVKIDAGPEATRAAAAARLLAHRKPAGAAEVLLAYLPFAADEPVVEEVRAALTVLAMRDGKPEPALVAALDDKGGIRRTVAVEALCRAGVKELKARYLEILKATEPKARLPIALALFEARQREAVPVLIDLLAQLPPGDVWRVEEALRAVAGDNGPPVVVYRDKPASPVRDAWAAWWHKHAATVDLAKLDHGPRLLGYTLVTYMEMKGSAGHVLEVDREGKVRWDIGDLRYPVDAQLVGSDRVLVAEYLGRRVTERDLQGKILWERQVDLPIACQRLPGEQTFIATRRQLLVVDRAGKDVFTYQHQATSISAARKLPDGRMVVISSGTCAWLDADGKQVKSFPVGLVYTLGGNVDVLRSGHILVPEYNQNRVAEYDGDGKVCWSANVRLPVSAVRVPSGNTLVSTVEQRVVELDRQGREVWSYTAPGRTWRARKR